MNKRIFRAGFLTSLLVIVISFGLLTAVLYQYFENRMLDELKSEADYISYLVEHEGTEYIDNAPDNDKRITLVAPDGTVIADTAEDASKLDNHSDREEIREAMAKGSGESFRYSGTLMEKTIYYAVKNPNGSVLRVSTTENSVAAILLGLMWPFSVIFVIAVIVSYILSWRASKSIVASINGLDLENPSINETYEELTPLLKKILVQKRTIDEQIKEARQKQEEFKLITENMNEGFLVVDSHSNVLTYNKSALRLLEAEEGTSMSALAFNRTKGFRLAIEKALSGSPAQKDITVDSRRYNLIANPIYESDKVIGAVIVIIDVTENFKREQLRREFTSNVSHELKTPLTSISGFAEIMKEGGMSDETVVDFSTSIYDEAQRLISLVSDIINLSEFDENSVEYESETVDLYELSDEIVNRLMLFARKNGVTISLSGESAKICGVRKILDEMIYNLCENAIKYNRENGSVTVNVSEDENSVTLRVEDTGIGIPISEQSRVFERFYRVDKSHSKMTGGTGLGLAIVKHAASYHNAQINLDSKEGKGTTISVVFKKGSVKKI